MSPVTESYITHISITEDVVYPSSPPPPTASPDNVKKPRLIVVAVRSSGRVRVHKARRNQNGTFSIGKTWDLNDLTAIKSFTTRTEILDYSQDTARNLQEIEWAGDVGFIVVLGKPYYWQADSAMEKQFFIASLVKVYAKYSRGKLPILIGFDSREREQLLGVSAAESRRAAGPDAKVAEELNDGEVPGQVAALRESLNREMKIKEGSENMLEALNTKKPKETKEIRQRVEAELYVSIRKIKLLRNRMSELQRPKLSSTPTAVSTSATPTDEHKSTIQLYQSVLDGPCSICGKDLEHDGVQTVPCEHKFHLNCLGAWQRTHGHKCPQW